MPFHDYKVTTKIGTGSFGSASICHRINDPHHKYVMKQINLDGLSVHDTKSAIQEAELLRHLTSPCIVKYIDSFVTNSRLAIIMEYCDGGDLSTQIINRRKSNLPFNENEIKCILYQISIALNHCHSHHILHRDVKTSNIFISTTNNRIKLGDFGVSRVLQTDISMAETQIGTPYYISPEICKGQPYSFKSDIWSFGCVVYELMNLHRPFEGEHIASLVMAITSAKYKPLRNIYSIELRTLIDSMLSIDPKQRPLTEHILNHKSLQNIKRKYEHLLSPKQNEDILAKSQDEVNGLTAEFTQLQLMQNGLPRISSSSAHRSSTESGRNLSAVYNELISIQTKLPTSKPKQFKSNKQEKSNTASKAITPSYSKAQKKAMKKMEKQQKMLRERAERREQRKTELRQHIKKQRQNKSIPHDIQIDFVGDFEDNLDDNNLKVSSNSVQVIQSNTDSNKLMYPELQSLEKQTLQMMGILASEHEAELIRMQLEKELGLNTFLRLYKNITHRRMKNTNIDAVLQEIPENKKHLISRIQRLLELEELE